MSLFYTDGTWTTASGSLITFEYPFPEVNQPYVLRQTFKQFLANYAPLDLNTAHATYTDYKLVEESALTNLGGGVVEWTRTYAKLPDDFSQFESTNYNFIGFAGTAMFLSITSTMVVTGRLRFVKSVTSRVLNEFFLVGTGGSYTEALEIPVITAQEYYISDPTVKTDYLGDSTVLATESTPTRTDYETMIGAGDEIVAEDSRLTHWLGNYWLRQTRYIKAQ